MAYGFEDNEYKQLLNMLNRAGGGNLMGAPAANIGIPEPAQTQAMPPGMIPGRTPFDQQLEDVRGRQMDMSKLIPALALLNIGTALQTRKDLRPAIQAQLPNQIMNAFKAQGDAAREKALMGLQAQYIKAQTSKSLSTDQLLAQAIQSGDQEMVERITSSIREKKPEPIEKPLTRTIQRGTEKVTQEYDFNSRSWQDVAAGPAWNPKERQGVSVTLPDGTQIGVGGASTRGGGANQVGIAPQTMKDVEKGILDVTEGLSDTHRISRSFDPNYATIGGQWEGFKNRLSDKMGYSLNPDDQKQLEGFTGYRAEAGRVFANTLKKLSGTAVTEPEMKRQEVYLINPGTGIFDGDSPSQVKTKIDKFLSFQRQAVARLNYIRKNGLSIRNAGGDVNFSGINLDKMPGIIKGYGQELGKKLAKETGWAENDPRLIDAVQKQTAEYFGLVQ